jgi:hypothetical protein
MYGAISFGSTSTVQTSRLVAPSPTISTDAL